MTIPCFLQNVWVKDAQGLRDIFARHPENRVGIIRRLLFYKCLTGRRILVCFGEDLINHMIFEEASLEIADDPRTVCPPDPEHIHICLEKYRPQVILTFGRVATDAVRPIWGYWNMPPDRISRFISCPHPAARQKDTVDKLKAA